MNDRTPKRLDQLGSVARGKSRHRPRNDPALYGGRWPFFQTGDVKAAELYLHSFSQTYNDAGLAQSRLWPAGTLCITIAANIADTAILGIPGCFPDSIVGFIADPAHSDARFVKYYIETLKQGMQNASRGTTQDNLSVDKLLTFEFLVPSAQRQRDIASILSAYDDLIENNTRRIAILEEMARRIYQEWFVRFRFPGHEGVRMVESALGLVPEGWAITELGALLSVEKGLSYKGSGLTGDGVPMVNLKNILPGGGFRRDGTKPYSGEYKPRHVVRAGDIVLANTDLTQAGTVVGSPAIVPNLGVGDCIFSHHIYAVRLQAALVPYRPYVYWLLAHDSFKSFAKGHAVGTTVLGMPKEGVTNFRLARPPEDLMRRFSSLASPIHDLAETLHAKNANLRATRDLLLPKLISGELDVSAMPEPEALAA